MCFSIKYRENMNLLKRGAYFNKTRAGDGEYDIQGKRLLVGKRERRRKKGEEHPPPQKKKKNPFLCKINFWKKGEYDWLA